jgi:hypothetical protein
MIQAYFFLVFSNLILGTMVVAEKNKEKSPFFSKLSELVEVEIVRVVMGIIGVVSGIFGLIAVLNDVPVIGNLVPALTSIALGMIFVMEYYSNRSPDSQSAIPALEGILVSNKAIIGYIGLGAGLLHFFAAEALFI